MVQSTGPTLSVVFVDYDNIYLSLKRKNEEAARRFAKDAGGWLRGLETGRLIKATQGANFEGPRRIVLNRCYGNPSPRRNPTDNSTDMNSFPFVRHHFLRSGFEVVDCPPLTAQLKNSADIKMVMDVLDFLKHQTYFDEFVLLSGDADFTPVLHRLRAHARRTIVYANDHTATPYTAISDGEVRESDLITLLMEGRIAGNDQQPAALVERKQGPTPAQIEQVASNIVAEVMGAVQSSGQPVPLEALADRAIRVLGHDRTVGTNWAGAGSFRDLLLRRLPSEMRMSDQPPYYIFDTSRQLTHEAPAREPRRLEAREQLRSPELRTDPRPDARLEQRPDFRQDMRAEPQRVEAPQRIEPRLEPQRPAARAPAAGLSAYAAPAQSYAPQAPAAPVQQRPSYAPQPAPAAAHHQPAAETETPAQIQQSIARIHEACQAPPLSPPDYRSLFEAMAEEITVNGLTGAQTISNIAQRTQQAGADIHQDDIRFVMEVVSEPDPWFEQGASPVLLANRFRNYVIAQCRRQHMQLSATEIDLIEMWFTGNAFPQAQKPAPQPASVPARGETADTYRRRGPASPQQPAPPLQAAQPPSHGQQPLPGARQVPPKQEQRSERWWHDNAPAAAAPDQQEEDFPRIMRPRVRG